MKFSALLASGLILMSASARADLVGFWDFNGNLDRTAGLQGDLFMDLVGYGSIGLEGYGVGTEVNLPDGFSAGQSYRFYNLAQIVETTRVEVLNLDLTGYTAPVISIAARNDSVFTAGDSFKLEYNIGGGWVEATTFADPDNAFQTFSFAFPAGTLDGVANVGIRFAHFTGLTALNEFAVDNLQVTATPVPEPSTLALVASAVVAIGFGMSRRRRLG